MLEIETKFKVNDKKKLLDILEKDFNCKFSDKIFQEDVIFLPKEKATYPIPAGLSVIRIRNENNKKNIVTLKQKQKNRVAAKEIEFVVDNPEAVEDFLEAIDYKEVVRVSKCRTTAKYQDFSFCMDEVEKLGFVFEIEKMANDNSNIEQTEKEIDQLAETLGIDINQKLKNRYDTLLYNIEHNKE